MKIILIIVLLLALGNKARAEEIAPSQSGFAGEEKCYKHFFYGEAHAPYFVKDLSFWLSEYVSQEDADRLSTQYQQYLPALVRVSCNMEKTSFEVAEIGPRGQWLLEVGASLIEVGNPGRIVSSYHLQQLQR